VVLGGVPVTCDEALRALAVLGSNRATAIRAVLAAAGSPLKDCDYWAVARPHLDCARAALPAPDETGPSGRRVHRHLAKDAFARAVRSAVARASAAAAADAVAAALEAMREDERYAAAMASDAVELHRRAHDAAARVRVRAAVAAAVSACAAKPVTLSRCQLSAACGTGQCPFAAEELRGCPVPAAPGKTPRPRAHALAGQGFSEAQAAVWLAAAEPWQASVHVRSADLCGADDDIAA
jgi:hypothetical protein